MINFSEYAKIVQNTLNKIVQARGYNFVFKIYSTDAEFKKAVTSVTISSTTGEITAETKSQKKKPTPIIHGILSFLPTSTIPLTDLGIFNISTSLDVLCPIEGTGADSQPNANVINAIESLYAQNTGANGTLTDTNTSTTYKYIWAINTPQTGQEQNGVWGRAVPIGMNMTWYLIKGGVLFDDIGIYVTIGNTDVKALCTDWAFEKNVNPQTDNVDGAGLLRSYAQSQSFSLTLTLPFTDNAVCTALWSDALGSTLGTEYIVSIKKANVTTVKTMIVGNIKINCQTGLNGVIQATFMQR